MGFNLNRSYKGAQSGSNGRIGVQFAANLTVHGQGAARPHNETISLQLQLQLQFNPSFKRSNDHQLHHCIALGLDSIVKQGAQSGSNGRLGVEVIFLSVRS